MQHGSLKFQIMIVDKTTGDLSDGAMTQPVNFDPDSLTHNRKVQMVSVDGSDNAGTTTQVKGKGPDTVSFDLFLDGTGAIPSGYQVNSEIAWLYDILFETIGEIHSPNVLRIVCNITGLNRFEGTVDSFNTTYSLFKPDGTPLRAKVSLSFTQYTKEKQNEARADMSSPDMSHANTVNAGDHLALKCHETYNEVGQYINVARYNGLVNFRKLEIGSNLYLPPLN